MGAARLAEELLMDVVWALMAVAATGVTYDWQPVADQNDKSKSSGFEYIVQVEPALVEAARNGELQVIESNVPAHLGKLQRVRIVLGGDKSATQLASQPLKRRHVAKPVVQESSRRHTVRQQGSAGQPIAPNLSNAAGQLEQGFRQATQGLQNGLQQAGQAAGSARQAFNQPFAAQPDGGQRKSIGSELLNGANKLRERTRNTIRNTGQAIDGSVQNLSDGLRTVVTGGNSNAPAPAPAGSGGFVPFSYGAAPTSGQTPTNFPPANGGQPNPAFGANPVLANPATSGGPVQSNQQQNNQQQGLYSNSAVQNQAGGQYYPPSTANQPQPQPSNQQPFPQQPNVQQQYPQQRNNGPARGLNNGDFVNSGGLTAPPLRNVGSQNDFSAGPNNNGPAYANQSNSQQDAWPNATGGSTGPGAGGGQGNNDRPFVSFVDSQNQPNQTGNGSGYGLTGDGLVRVTPNNTSGGVAPGGENFGNGNFGSENFGNDNFSAGTGNGASGPYFPAGNGSQSPDSNGLGNQPGQNPTPVWPAANGADQNPPFAGGQPPFTGPVGNPANLPPLGAPDPSLASQNPNGQYTGTGYGPNPNMPATPNGNQPWGMFVFTSLICLGSLGGNLFLGWSYLDARNKYQSALRRTVRTFSRNSGDV